MPAMRFGSGVGMTAPRRCDGCDSLSIANLPAMRKPKPRPARRRPGAGIASNRRDLSGTRRRLVRLGFGDGAMRRTNRARILLLACGAVVVLGCDRQDGLAPAGGP